MMVDSDDCGYDYHGYLLMLALCML
jgi:hypothetical protein